VSNRKAHRRDKSFHRAETFAQHRLRRPGRSDRHERQIANRRARRGIWKTIAQWLLDVAEAAS
jgi:hypothetical protein